MTLTRRRIVGVKLTICLVLGLVVLKVYQPDNLFQVAAQGAQRFAGPTSSQPIALSANDSLLAVANPDNDSVTLFNVGVGGNELTRLAEVAVGDEPHGVAVLPNGSRVYAANTISGTAPSSIHKISRLSPTLPWARSRMAWR